MVRIRRRDFVLVAAILAASGCMVLGGTLDRRGTTQVRSAEISTGTPTLQGFVVRIAVADVSLDPSQSALASGLARDSDAAARRIDEARVVFIEELSRAVETRQFAAPNALLAGNAVVDETANAATQLDQILAKLHGSLAPWQRRRLATRVRARYEDWRPAWKAGAYEEHAWLESIATDHLASSVDDARATARRWVDALLADVRAGEKLDDEGRRELVARLRQAGPK